MISTSWMAVVAAGVTAWVWLPPDGLTRLRRAAPWRLPAWAQPVPGAMDSRKRWWVGGIVGAVVLFYGSGFTWEVMVAAPLIVVGVWVGLGRLEPAAARRRRVQLLEAAPEAFGLVLACVHSGQPLRRAVDTVARAMPPPVLDVLGLVGQAIGVGMSEADAWLVLADDPVLGMAARDLSRSAAWGTGVSDVITEHCARWRRAGKSERMELAKAVGVRGALPLGLCYLPAFVMIGVVPVIAAGLASVFS